jgi:two-component system cell cycle sensor histidine kinase/response regulator CckA
MQSAAILGGPVPRPSTDAGDDTLDLQAQVRSLRDEVAELRAAESQLRRALSRSDDAQQRQLALLAGGMAHDFNNLLTIIAGYAMLLNEDEQTSPAARERLAEILRASSCAKDLTQKLLILSRKQPCQPRVFEVDQFLRKEAVQPLGQLAGARIDVRTRLAAREICINTDPADLMHVLTNLVLNARDAMPAGGTLTITTSHEAAAPRGTTKGAYVRVAITDTGAGMDPAVQSRLFEPFFSTKRIGSGAGLGLAIVKTLIERDGGFVEAQSAPSAGTTMTLWLPVAEHAPRHGDQTAPSTVTSGGKETVLIVEDDAAVRELTRAVLARFGYDVTDAAHPQAALRLVRAGHRFDLIVSDVVMPDMDGRAMVRELEQIAPGFQVLYVSGYADAKGDGVELQNDPAHFLAKPFTPTALAQKVRDVLDAR